MDIVSFLLGVLATICGEIIALFILAVITAVRKVKHGN